jgi:hypothetical protein
MDRRARLCWPVAARTAHRSAAQIRPGRELVSTTCLRTFQLSQALRARRAAVVRALLLVASLSAGLAAQAPARKPVDDVLQALQQKYKLDDKKYDALAKKLDKDVRAALNSTVWLEAEEGHPARTFKEHPWVVLVSKLADAARADTRNRKNSPEETRLLTKFPWKPALELTDGLQYGSDRPVPQNENGFIELGSAAIFPGYPELTANHYLFGLHEIVGSDFRIKKGKKPEFAGRTPKDPPVAQTELSDWEQIRVYLEGSLPEVPLYAIPWLTHEIHSRLADRRKPADGKPVPMDELLALLDSKWNGFSFEAPWGKDRISIVAPPHDLLTDNSGFAYQFPKSAQMASVGDLPFISVLTLQQYAQAFRGEKIEPGDFIQVTPAAKAAQDQFTLDGRYLTRYKSLIDVIVRAVLQPNLRYPLYLQACDYPDGKVPDERGINHLLDKPRKYSLVLWACAGEDPAKLADMLQDDLLGKPANAFPADVPVQLMLSQVVIENEAEMLKAVTDRIAKERGSTGAPADYEREFSPYPKCLDVDGLADSSLLIDSYTELQGRVATLIQNVAYADVLKEVGG